MSSQSCNEAVAPECQVLAEAVGEGLHSLAQPLTTALWNMELLLESLPDAPPGVAKALRSVEMAVTRLDVVRDLIRPYRATTVFAPASLHQALTTAWMDAKCSLESEGVRMLFDDAASTATVLVPETYLDRVAAQLLEVVRAVGPDWVRVGAVEVDGAVRHDFTLSAGRRKQSPLCQTPGMTTLSGYVRVLGGTLTTSSDGLQLCIELPRHASSSTL